MESRKNTKGTSQAEATVLRERSGNETTVTDRDLTTTDQEPVLIKRKHDLAVPSKTDGERELRRVSIQNECSTFVELE